MSPPAGVLAAVDDSRLRDDVDRVAAAVSVLLVHCPGTVNRREWSAAAAIVLDETAARRCTQTGLPRRPRVILIVSSEPDKTTWQSAATTLGRNGVDFRCEPFPAIRAESGGVLGDTEVLTSAHGRSATGSCHLRGMPIEHRENVPGGGR